MAKKTSTEKSKNEPSNNKNEGNSTPEKNGKLTIYFKRPVNFLKDLQLEWENDRPITHAQATGMMLFQIYAFPYESVYELLPLFLKYTDKYGIQGLEGIYITLTGLAAKIDSTMYAKAVNFLDLNIEEIRKIKTKKNFDVSFIDFRRSNIVNINGRSGPVLGNLGLDGIGNRNYSNGVAMSSMNQNDFINSLRPGNLNDFNARNAIANLENRQFNLSGIRNFGNGMVSEETTQQRYGRYGQYNNCMRGFRAAGVILGILGAAAAAGATGGWAVAGAWATGSAVYRGHVWAGQQMCGANNETEREENQNSENDSDKGSNKDNSENKSGMTSNEDNSVKLSSNSTPDPNDDSGYDGGPKHLGGRNIEQLLGIRFDGIGLSNLKNNPYAVPNPIDDTEYLGNGNYIMHINEMMMIKYINQNPNTEKQDDTISGPVQINRPQNPVYDPSSF